MTAMRSVKPTSGNNNDRLSNPNNLHPEITLKRSMNNASSSRGGNSLAPRPLRRCRSASPAPPKAPLLSIEQQNLIKKSWQRVSKTHIGKSIYQKMTGKTAESLFMVDYSAIARHERYFVDLIQTAVENLTDMEKALQPWLEMIGKGHQGFAIKSKHWDSFGESVVTSISEWVGPGKMHRETIRAWMLLSSFISDRLGAASHRPLDNSNHICSTPRIQLLTLVTTGPTTPS